MNVEEVIGAAGESLSGLSFHSLSLSDVLRVVLTALICLVAIRVLTRVADRVLERSRLERSLSTFARSALRVLMWFIAVLIVLGELGVDVTSLIALLSVVGVAVSLALQSTLSNLAGGILLLVTKPFVSGDYVETGADSGTVQDIGLAYTTLTTIDNKLIYVPNSEIAGARIVNYNGRDTRRLNIKVSVSYNAPPQAVRAALEGLLAGDGRIHADEGIFVRISAYNSSSIEYTVRAWCDTQVYWDVYYDVMDAIKPALDAAGVEMTYDHLNVHLMDRK